MLEKRTKTPVLMLKKWTFLITLFLSLFLSIRAQSSSYEQTIRSQGFVPGQTHDWSHESEISLPQPRLAYINLRSKYGIPYTKTSNFRDTIEYYDAMGNYFMKRAIVNVQGATSTSFPKRNVKLQLIDDEWQGEVMPTVDFDGWVKQDHFHLKAFYTDWLRGIGIVGYQLFDQIEQQMPASSNRIWKRAGVEGHKNARCYPDGFPCMMFLNGEFWGICTWQLAKHRRNMAQEKHNALHIHLDGNMNETNFWLDNLKWKAFEVRNPKGLYDMEGNAYDEGAELIDSSSPYYALPYDSEDVRQAKQRSAQVKLAVINLTRRVGEVADLKQSGASTEEIREAIARHFDVESMVNYLVFSIVTSNYDGFAKNWQWLTYDGGETWHVAPYDLDCTFGNYHEGTLVFPARFSYSDSDYRFKISRRGIATWFWDYYKDEIRARYAELRDCGIFSPKNISGLIHAWHDRIGSDLYDMEWARWPNALCISQTITNPGWEASDDWTDHFNHLPEWKEDVTYQPGDVCRLARRVWIATGVTTGVRPYQQLGYTDSLERLDAWIEERIALEDSYFGYTPPEALDEVAAPAAARAIAVLAPDGTPRSRLVRGINIVRYDDGTSRIVYLH